MSMQDKIADMLTRIRNSLMAKHMSVNVPYTKLNLEVIKILVQEGYLQGYTVDKVDGHQCIMVQLKYWNDKPVIEEIARISRPSIRVYSSKSKLPKIYGGLGIVVVSTSAGVMTDKAARAKGLGGELLCYVY